MEEEEGKQVDDDGTQHSICNKKGRAISPIGDVNDKFPLFNLWR